MINAVIFDMDGLLFDSERLYIELYKKLESTFGVCLPEQIYIDCIGTTMELTREIIVSAVSKADFDYEEFRIAVDEAFERRRMEGGLSLKKGARQIIETLYHRGLPLGVASSTHRSIVDSNLQHAGLSGFITTVTGGDEVERGKPHPEIYLKTASVLGIAPREALVFEDSEAGISAAAAAGMRVVAVPDLKPPSEEILRSTYWVCGSLLEVVGRLDTLLQ